MLFGCAATSMHPQGDAYQLMAKSFQSMAPCPHIQEVVTLENVTVHIVGDRSLFSHPLAAAPHSRVAGYANTNNEIHVLGRRLHGKVVLNPAVLGHEMMHLLNFQNPTIADPDHLETLSSSRKAQGDGSLRFAHSMDRGTTTSYLRQAFILMQKDFHSLPACPHIQEVITLERVTVHIGTGFNSTSQTEAPAPFSRSPIARSGNAHDEIHVAGRRFGENIVLNQAVLGRELMHLLHATNPQIAKLPR